jgi:hypothetical protein
MVPTDYFTRDEVDIVVPPCDVSGLIEAVHRDEAKLLIPTSRHESVDSSAIVALLKLAREETAVIRNPPAADATEMAERERETSRMTQLPEDGRAIA